MTTERESKAADQQASYAARGREFEKLSGDDLTARWRLAFAAVAELRSLRHQIWVLKLK